MSFESELRAFGKMVPDRVVDVVTVAGDEVHRSLVYGSELTGAPGQRVDTGFLRDSFIPERISDLEWQTTTNVAYAPAQEDNDRSSYDPAGVQRPKDLEPEGGTNRKGPSTVGGSYSKKLTEAAWPRIIDHSVKQVVPQ